MTRPLALLSLLLLPCLAAAGPALAEDPAPTPKDLVGAWVFAEDRSDPKPPQGMRPNMGKRFVVEEDGATLVVKFQRGGQDLTHRYALDGTEEVVTYESSVSHHSGRWTDGRLRIDTRRVSQRTGGATETTVSHHVIRPVGEGLLIHFRITAPIEVSSTCLYKRAPEGAAAAPTPAQAGIEALAWLAGAWTGTMGKAAIEERWSPAGGGAMLAVARTVAGGRMVAFEYLRVVQRDGGLVYVAQPNGSAPTEFVATQVGATKAVFENPAHDFPQRITYELSAEGVLTAEISDTAGSRAQRFRFEREASAR